MTNEEKKQLIERCEQKIKELSKVQFGIMHKDKLDLLIYCEAIAALTAKPIKLPTPKRFDTPMLEEPYYVEAIAVLDVVAAIHTAGYEVEVQE